MDGWMDGWMDGLMSVKVILWNTEIKKGRVKWDDYFF
jgi:hypothetical protein